MRVGYLIIVIVLSATLWGGCKKAESSNDRHWENSSENAGAESGAGPEISEVSEKGYDLPVEEEAQEEAVADCTAVMDKIRDIYIEAAHGGDTDPDGAAEKMMAKMKESIKENGVPVIGAEEYSDMCNYQSMEEFLTDAGEGKAGEVILYEIARDGSITRKKYTYDGAHMYLLTAKALWDEEDRPTVPYISCSRIKEWDYTGKGWFGYELSVPEPPEVTEMVDGCSMVRVKPMSEECRELSEKYVLPLGYQGNNLLCSDWNRENMEELDYNGAFEYLYQMKNQNRFDGTDYPEGIPAEEFEKVIMEYLPVTAEQIRQWAAYDEEHQSYLWKKLGCMGYIPTSFGTSLPEVVEKEGTEEGMIRLTVEAVCDRRVCDDAVITHELTIRPAGDGSFQYIGNKILEDGVKDIPAYQYRFEMAADKGEFAYEN